MRYTGFPPKVVRIVNQRATIEHHTEPMCEIWAACTGARAVHRHHRLPRRAGGTRRPEVSQASNCLAACLLCHEWVETHRVEAKTNGWLLSAHQNPAAERVLYRSRWLLLTDDGGYQHVSTHERAAQ